MAAGVNRLDLVMLKRVGGRVILSIVVAYGILAILESLDWPRYLYLVNAGGLPLALTALAAAAGRWALRTLPVTVLVGTIIGVLSLQARHELNIIKASGVSIWRIVRAPILAIAAGGLVVSLLVDSAVTQLDRSVNPMQTNDTGAVTPDGAFWLQQSADGFRYVLRAGRAKPGGDTFNDVTIFLYGDGAPYERILAPEMLYTGTSWLIPEGTGFRVGTPPRRIEGFSLPTDSTPADIKVRISSTQYLTIFELGAAMTTTLTDPILAAAVATRFMRLLTLPLLLIGSVLIAFAFTAGYRRTNKYGAAVLYGMVLGFVVFFVTEVADRAGSAGALNPTFAAVAPALVAVVVGLTVLLYREDGRA